MRNDIWLIEENIDVERREWPVLRAGWVLMGLFVMAGIAGAFGEGLFTRTLCQNSHFSVTYDRFLRYSMNSEIVINASSLGADSSVYLNSDYLKKVKIEAISPQPEAVKLDGKRMRLKFASRKPEDIILYLSPINRGSQQLTIELNGKKVSLKQFIYI